MKYLGIALFICLAACSKDGNNKLETLRYNQTQCMDLWGYGNTDSITISYVSHYLDSLGLYHTDMSIGYDTSLAKCNSCGCPDGYVIYLTTYSNLEAQYAPIGFKPQQ